ncbi:hypothetical protein CIB87_12355 [Priestia megaterium]|uniref:ATPase AAA-type core domain-containing protein n=1 Tax=Priestia megaterium TaxID=1404 RepID=A0AA86I0Z5_PRIMG|nr:AAA family ATPase [Priestia megaterium]AXI29764.1 hypothetical protein CIB87_12355 [Priestia megaterium]
MLCKVEIDNFKGLKNKIISFNNFSVMVGQNNVGKTTTLQSIIFVQELLKHAIVKSRKEGRQYEVRNIQFSDSDINKIPIAETKSIWFNNQVNRSGSLQIKLYFDNDEKIEVTLFKVTSESNLVNFWGSGKISDETLDIFLNQNYAINIPGLTTIPSAEVYIGEKARQRIINEGNQHQIIRNIIYSLSKKEEDFTYFKEILKEFYTNLEELDVEYDETTDEFVNVQYSLYGSDESFDIINLGTGLLQVIQIFAYTLVFKPKLLLLDEPDVHLHADNKVKLLKNLEKMSEKLNIQIIFTTHSRDILANANKDSIIWVNEEKEIILGAERGRMVQAFIELGALSELEQLRLRPNIAHIMVEDKNSVFWKKLFAHHIGDNWTESILLSSFKGKSSKKFLFLLSEFHTNFFESSRLASITDKDFDTEEVINAFKGEAERYHIKPWILPVHEIENYLITPKVLFSAINSQLNDSEVTEEEVVSIITHAIRETREDNISKYSDYIKGERKLQKEEADELAEKEYDIYFNLSLEEKVAWMRGKPLLKKIRKEVKDTYNVSLSDKTLCESFNAIDLPPDLREIVDWIKR